MRGLKQIQEINIIIILTIYIYVILSVKPKNIYLNFLCQRQQRTTVNRRELKCIRVS